MPPGEDIKEWLAVNTVDFYNAISVLYSTLAEFCTDSSCEVMSAGSKVRERCAARAMWVRLMLLQLASSLTASSRASLFAVVRQQHYAVVC